MGEEKKGRRLKNEKKLNQRKTVYVDKGRKEEESRKEEGEGRR